MSKFIFKKRFSLSSSFSCCLRQVLLGHKLKRSDDGSYFSYPFGLPGDFHAPGDYDGDGKFDSAVFRPSIVTWYINGSTAGSMIMTFDLKGDHPIANAPVPSKSPKSQVPRLKSEFFDLSLGTWDLGLN